MGFVDEFPLTNLLGLAGLLIGSVIVPYTSLGQHISIALQDPVTPLIGYFNETLTIFLKKFVLGLVFGLILGSIGLLIDLWRREE